ncbi:hypothetical protein [Halomicrobium salinisoli]|uniref:hypothetical protein n=1 Tax=Halomicrobium salinisoli TaxID=2878391 RepID=UPI001CEFC09C|nr:hypothetical protein [Halomicrobium salinisoli]
MHPTFGAGVALALAGLGGYVAGVHVSYPGRAFSLTALMAGVTLALVGRGEGAT